MVHRPFLRRRAGALLVALPLLTSCYHYHLYQTGGPGQREAGNQPGSEWRSATRHALAWGAIRQDIPDSTCRGRSAATQRNIEEVKVTGSFAYTLATVATLGFWSPLKVQWRCARPAVIADSLR